MDTYQIGDVRLVRIVDGSIDVDAPGPVPAWCVPDYAPGADTISIAFGAFALEVDGVSIVVDPWLTTDGSRDLPDASDHADRLAGELTAAGFPPDDVDLVVFTHIDGIGWSIRPTETGSVPMFPNARYLVTESTISAWTRGDLEVPDAFADLMDTGIIDPVDPDSPVTDHTSLESTEGHTLGHAVVRVDTGAAELVLAGHLFIFPNQVSDPSIANDADHALAAEQRQDLLADLADSGGVLFAQLLGGCGGGTVVADADDGHRLVPLTPVPS